jgi:Zn-dependent protease
MEVDPLRVAASLIVIFFAIGLHEYAHCKLADAAGDPTPRYFGRVTLNLFKHFDPMGSIMIIITTLYGFGIGWGKPAPMDSRRMRNPRWDFFAAVAAGPICNFFQAVIYAVIIRIVIASGGGLPLFLGFLLFYGVVINLSLMFFNLIPLGPLDGHWLIGQLLPENIRYKWNQWNTQMGTYILFGLIFLGQFTTISPLRFVLGPPVDATFKFLTGISFS